MGKWIVLSALVLAALSLGVKTTIMSTIRNIASEIAAAIQQFEGWYPGSRSYRNNNPGNLKFANQAGATGRDEEGHAIFESYEAGWNALIKQIEIVFTGQSAVYSPNDSFYEFFQKYAEGNSLAYAQFVSEKLGVSPETKFIELLG